RAPVIESNSVLPFFGNKRMLVRLERKGGSLKASVSAGDGNWIEKGTTELPLPAKLKVGVLAVSTSLSLFKPHYSDFRLTTADKTATAVKPAVPEKDLRKPPT